MIIAILYEILVEIKKLNSKHDEHINIGNLSCSKITSTWPKISPVLY